RIKGTVTEELDAAARLPAPFDIKRRNAEADPVWIPCNEDQQLLARAVRPPPGSNPFPCQKDRVARAFLEAGIPFLLQRPDFKFGTDPLNAHARSPPSFQNVRGARAPARSSTR